MAETHHQFDRSKLKILPLSVRQHLVDVSQVLKVGQQPMPYKNPSLADLAKAIVTAGKAGAAVVMMMGAHVIKQGLGRYVADFIRRGWVSAVATNGACAIHDYELARVGATSESVSRYIAAGQFGLWTEPAEINDIVTASDREGLGFGQAVGRAIATGDMPHKDVSIYAAAYEAGVPITVHIGVGYDIIHEHPNFDPAAAAAASYRDFLILAEVIRNLEGGVVMCFGSAVMGPEVYLKALAMARNVAAQEGKQISHFTSAVFDLMDLTGDLRAEAPKDASEYYYRPYKTMLVRTVRDGGRSYYFRGDHLATMPTLHAAVLAAEAAG